MQRCQSSAGVGPLQVQAIALQQQRGFAEKAVAAEFDWDSITDLVHSDEGKREVTSLRSAYTDIKGRLEGLAKVRGAGMIVRSAVIKQPRCQLPVGASSQRPPAPGQLCPTCPGACPGVEAWMKAGSFCAGA